MYWVSLIVQDTKISTPYVCSLTDSISSLEAALAVISEKRKSIIVLSAWIDVFSSGKKVTVFHECYVNSFGGITKH